MTPQPDISGESDVQTFFNEFLLKYLDGFIKDFDFRDVQAKVIQFKIFSEEECDRINSMVDSELQVILLFTLLLEKNKDIHKFLELINEDYSWLYQYVRQDQLKYRSGNKEMQLYPLAVHELTLRFPKYSNLNIRRIQYYTELRKLLISLKPRIYLVVSGQLGFGKKWLVLDVCRDYAVLRAMNYKIFWLDVYDCDTPEKDLECLQRLKILLGKSSSKKNLEESIGMNNKILEIQQHIRNILKEEDFADSLLILSNVKNLKTVQAFNFPCKILIITRNKKIAENLPKHSTKSLNITNGFNKMESSELFKKILPKPHNELPLNFPELLEQSKGHPFLLTTVAQNLKERSLPDSNKWIDNLLSDFQIKDDKITALIKLSLNGLTNEELKLYHMFCVFNHSVKIPVSLLTSYWEISEWDANKLIDKFEKFSLITVTKMKCGARACSLHFLYYSYLQNCVQVDKEALNRKLIDCHNLTNILNQREDVDLNLTNDEYFYYYIGHHLQAAGMADTLSSIYLDFGFLEQKLRVTGLPNTIGDLKFFRKEIIGGCSKKSDILDALLDFLPNIEETIFKSEDACLLQYALMTDKVLREEAIKQASRYKRRVWFHDSDHFHERRQMVRLRRKPKVLCLVDPDSCIAALEDYSILFADLSCDYNTEPTVFKGHESEVIKICLFDKFFISLDVDGVMKCWSIENELRHNLCTKQNTKLIAKQIDYSTLQNARQRTCIQTINRKENHPDLKAKYFYLEKNQENIILHTAMSDGRIVRHHWDPVAKMFEKDPLPPITTKDKEITFVLKVQSQYMIINKSGYITFFDLVDNSRKNYESQWIKNTKVLSIHYFKTKTEQKIIFVFETNVVQLVVSNGQGLQNLVTDPIDYLYDVDDKPNTITCSVLSEDNQYLILGTVQGILVFDLIHRCEVLRNSISEQIVCLDICRQDDEFYKYIIVSGSQNESKLNIFGLKLSWDHEHNRNINPNIQLKPNTWFVGQKLFDVVSGLDNELSVIAVDSKNSIHHLRNNKISTPIRSNFPSKITAVATSHKEYFLGFENGIVMNSCGETLFSFLTPNKITFLDWIQNIIVCSTQYNCILFKNRKDYRYDFGIVKSFIYKNKYLILINATCGYTVLEIENDFKILQNVPNDSILGGADLQMDTLIIAAKKHAISFCEFDVMDISQTVSMSRKIACTINVTSLAISGDGSICAIGYENGAITLLKREADWNEMQTLQSHKSKIYDLKFSHWSNPNLPIILVSIAEQFCFWNISHIINNPMHRGDKQRRSTRFNSRLESLKQDASEKYSFCNHSTNAWCNKQGALQKPELLSCIKFIGTRAEKFYANDDFTKFITIDNEGEVYFLALDDSKLVFSDEILV